MAMRRECNPHRLGLFWGSARCHRTLASLQGDLLKPVKGQSKIGRSISALLSNLTVHQDSIFQAGKLQCRKFGGSSSQIPLSGGITDQRRSVDSENHRNCVVKHISSFSAPISETRFYDMISADEPHWYLWPQQNAKYPDFVHKKTQGALWLNGRSNPHWVEAALKALPPGSVQADTFSWNTRLTRLLKAGKYDKTIELFQQMKQEGMKPDKFTFVPVLNACAGLQALKEGKHIHTQIVQSGFELDVYVGSSLIGMYAKCGEIADARILFNKLPVRTVVSWNIMILGYVKCGQGGKALELFHQMQQGGLEPVNITFVAALNACASLGALEEGKKIHKEITRRGFQSDVFVNSSLIDMYAKCCSIDHAEGVFNETHKPDVVSWSAMIQGYVKCGQAAKALELSCRMQQEGVEPVSNTFVGLLNACAKLGALEEGKTIHKWITQKGCESDIFIGTSLVDMYAKCGSIDDAWRVFNSMPARDFVSWTAMIQWFVKSGQGQRALNLYHQMQSNKVEPHTITFVGVLNACASLGALEEGTLIHRDLIKRGHEDNIFVSSSLVDMYTKCGVIETARRVFDRMSTRDVVAWNAMILGYVKCGQGRESLELSRQMCREGVDPDPVTFLGLLNVCASIGALEEGRQFHRQILELWFESDAVVGSSLVDMYAKCGSMEDACRVFNRMPIRNMVSWNAMPASKLHGNVEMGEHSRQGLDRGVGKQPGQSWIEVNGKVHSFTGVNQEHPQMDEIIAYLKKLSVYMEDLGYVPDARLASDVEKGALLRHHIENLAIAFGIISTPSRTPIRVFKNQRISVDCHLAIKLMTKIVGRAIIVRDASRFHCFDEGLCSCGDCW